MVMRLDTKCFLSSPARFSHLKVERSRFKAYMVSKTPCYEAYRSAYSVICNNIFRQYREGS